MPITTVKPEWALRILDTLASSTAWLQERAEMVKWPVPDAPNTLVSWALDELMIQIELVRAFPAETDRLMLASEMAFLASTLLWSGAMPDVLPWEKKADV